MHYKGSHVIQHQFWRSYCIYSDPQAPCRMHTHTHTSTFINKQHNTHRATSTDNQSLYQKPSICNIPYSAKETILSLLKTKCKSTSHNNTGGVKHISTLCLAQKNTAMLPVPVHQSSGGWATLGISSEVMQKEQSQSCPWWESIQSPIPCWRPLYNYFQGLVGSNMQQTNTNSLLTWIRTLQ